MRILCYLMLASVALQSLPSAAIVQQLQALPPCQAQANQEHPQQVQLPLCAAAGPPEMPLPHQADSSTHAADHAWHALGALHRLSVWSDQLPDDPRVLHGDPWMNGSSSSTVAVVGP